MHHRLTQFYRNFPDLTLFVLFVAVGFFAFFGGLDGDFAHTDNGLIVSGNAIIKNWQEFKEAFTMPEWKEPYGVGGNLRPMIFLSYSFDWWVSGGNPWFFHLTNLLLHTGCAWLLFVLFRRFTGHRNLLLVFCLLFLSHPIHKEAVYTISQGRTDLLAAFFMLAATILYLKAEEQNKKKLLLPSACCFAVSILSKEMGFVTIILQFIIWSVFLRRLTRITFLQIFALVSITIGYALWKHWFFGALGMANVPGPGMNMAPMTREEHLQMIMTFSRGFFAYLERFFYPVRMSFNDSFVLVTSSSEPVFRTYLSTLLFMLCLSLACIRRQPFVSAGLLFFFGAMAPISHIAPMLHFIGEHMFHIPAMGLTLALFGAFCPLYGLSRYFVIPLILLIPVFASINLQRAPIYANDYNLTKYNFGLAPYNPEAAHGYALELFRRKEFAEAIRVIETFMLEFSKETYTGFRPNPYKLWEILIKCRLELGQNEAAIDDIYYVFPIFRQPQLIKLLEKAYLQHFGMHGRAMFQRDFNAFLHHLQAHP